MADPSSQIQYDDSMLPSSILYDIRFNKKLGYLNVIVLFVVIVFSMADYVATTTMQLIVPSWLKTVFIAAAVSIAVCLYIWNNGLRNYFYKRYRNKFVASNGLIPIDETALQTATPESLKHEGAYDIKTEGYRYNFGDTPAILMDYTYTVGAGKSSETINCFAAVLKFTDKDYPHLFLDGKTNGPNTEYMDQQKVQLEGNFNNYFDLYMPKGSSAGALTILSPDVMQSLIDIARPFDVEINRDSVALIGLGLAYTRDNIQDISKAVSVLSSEFEDLNYSWQPVYDNKSLPFVLKRKPAWQKVAYTLLAFVCAYALIQMAGQFLMSITTG